MRNLGPGSLAAALAALLLAAAPAGARIAPAPEPGAMPNGPVSALALDGANAHLGGRFLEVGPHTGSGAVLRGGDGLAVEGMPAITGGEVDAVVGDGRGGWYLGGDFTAVGGLARRGLAHLLAGGGVERGFDPSPDGAVRALLRRGEELFVAGAFARVGGRVRDGLAALRLRDGAPLPWRPAVDGPVSALAGSAGGILLGGDFTRAGARARRGAALVDDRSGDPLAFDARLGGGAATVDGIAVAGGAAYLSGDFGTAGGQARPGLAEVSAVTGAPAAWTPEIGVRKPVVSGGRVYGLTGAGVAALDRADGRIVAEGGRRTAGPLGPSARAIAIGDGRVYVGSGDYRGVYEDVPRTLDAYDAGTLARIDSSGRPWSQPPSAAEGSRTAWGDVNALAAGGGRVFAGGRFDWAGGRFRVGAAGIGVGSGQTTAFDGVRGFGYGFDDVAIAAGAGVVATGATPDYAGGGVFSASDSSTLWRYSEPPAAPADVAAVAISGGTLYAGGFSIDGDGRVLVARDARSGAPLPWAPPGGEPGSAMEPRVILPVGDTVYVGGSFSVAGRRNLIAYDAATGAVRDAFAPSPDGPVAALAIHGGRLYAGGEFEHAGGGAHRNLAALDPVTGRADPAFSPEPNGPVAALAARGRTIVAGGAFTAIAGTGRRYLAALRDRDGRARRWAPEPDGPVRALAASEGRVLVGGAFSRIAGRFRAGFAQFRATGR